MEVLLYIFIFFLGLAFLFALIEFPYHLVGLLIFIVHYNYNIDLPGPLDLRGLLTIVLFLRLIVFDKNNLNVIFSVLFKNPLFLLIISFGIYFIIVTNYHTSSYKTIMRVTIFQIIGLTLGFITLYNGYGKKVFLMALLATAGFSVLDLVNHYLTSSGFHITRVLDKAFKSKYSSDWNHNTFGEFIGITFVVVYVLAFVKQMSIKIAILLLFIFSVGIVLSTSRGTMLAVFVALLVGTIIIPDKNINLKKIIGYGFSIIIFMFFLIFVSTLAFKSFGLKTQFADKLYYRLAEEPLSIISGDDNKFTLSGKKEVGTIEWRVKQAKRDIAEYSKLPIYKQLWGLGYQGYFKIGKKEWRRGKLSQYISHNGYVLMIIERGIIGFIIFLIMYLSLLVVSVKAFRADKSNFPFFIILLFYLVFTYGAQDQLLNRFNYILFGAIIGQYIYTFYVAEDDEFEDETVTRTIES